MLSLEDHVRIHGGAQSQQKWPTRDHEITHACASVSQVATAPTSAWIASRPERADVLCENDTVDRM